MKKGEVCMNNEYCQFPDGYSAPFQKDTCGGEGICNNICCPPPSCCQMSAPTVSIGATVTGEPGTSASVTNSGNSTNAILNFVIPRGATGAAGPQGPAGPQGATGPAGPAGDTDSTCCACKEQMRNIIQEIITLYPNNDLFITLESGDAVVGRPGSLVLGPNGRTGVFEVTNPQNFTQFLSICSIDTIQINNATYNNTIVYLPEPVPAPTNCRADCETTIRSLLPVGTDANIITSTQTPSTGTVIENEYGMIVLANEANNNITFISSCNIDLFYV